jgi:hypothetical protein
MGNINQKHTQTEIEKPLLRNHVEKDEMYTKIKFINITSRLFHLIYQVLTCRYKKFQESSVSDGGYTVLPDEPVTQNFQTIYVQTPIVHERPFSFQKEQNYRSNVTNKKDRVQSFDQILKT